MSRKQRTQPEVALPTDALPVTAKLFCVGKDSHLLYSAFEVDVVDGVVVGVKCLSRAPDMAQHAVSICTREISVALRTQAALPHE